MIEELIFFFKGSHDRALLGFLHQALHTKKETGIIFCHPFGDEHNLSYRVMVNTARSLAEGGFPVLRFDMSGCGDSEGELNNVVIEEWLEDLGRAVDALKSKTGVTRYILCGLRLGAGIVLLHEKTFQNALSLILLQPVLDFSIYIKHFLRRQYILEKTDGSLRSIKKNRPITEQLKEKGIVNALGYPISNQLYESFIRVGADPFSFRPACRTFLISISILDDIDISASRYIRALESDNVQITSQHLKVESFWDHNWIRECPELDDAILKWLNE